MEVAERELILRARQGDAPAFALLVRRYDRRILALALDMVGDVDDAQDVFQEALLAAYRGLSQFRMESDFSTWLYRIAVNKALKFRHRRQRTALREDGAAVRKRGCWRRRCAPSSTGVWNSCRPGNAPLSRSATGRDSGSTRRPR